MTVVEPEHCAAVPGGRTAVAWRVRGAASGELVSVFLDGELLPTGPFTGDALRSGLSDSMAPEASLLCGAGSGRCGNSDPKGGAPLCSRRSQGDYYIGKNDSPARAWRVGTRYGLPCLRTTPSTLPPAPATLSRCSARGNRRRIDRRHHRRPATASRRSSSPRSPSQACSSTSTSQAERRGG